MNSRYSKLRGLAVTVVTVTVSTLICFTIRTYVDLSNLIMIYLLGVVFIASRLGRTESVLASVFSVVAVDFFFVPPYFTLSVANSQYFITFAVMLIVALLISKLTYEMHLHALTSLEKEQESSAAKLQIEVERMRNALLSSVSHDLRTPLTVIAGTANLLAERTNGNSSLTELAVTISSEASRLNRHLTNLLDLTRLEIGLQPKLEWNSLDEIIGSALSRSRSQLGSRKVIASVSENLPLIQVDGVLVEKMLLNLLENVSRYTPDTAMVTIRVKETERGIALEMEDTGPGIDLNKKIDIFNVFYKPNAASKKGGFGLGLAICQTVMKLHGGSIDARNARQGGAVFTAIFPQNLLDSHSRSFDTRPPLQ